MDEEKLRGNRRIRADIIQIWKILNGMESVDERAPRMPHASPDFKMWEYEQQGQLQHFKIY